MVEPEREGQAQSSEHAPPADAIHASADGTGAGPEGGGPPGEGGPPFEGIPPGGFPDAPVPYKKLFKWGWYVVSGAFGWFVVNTVVGLVAQTLTQYDVQVLARVVSGLQGGPGGHGDGEAGGWLAAFVPSDVRTAAILFAALSVGLVLLNFADRALGVWTDNVMAARLQRRLHDKLLTLGSSYHGAHDVGETTLVVTRFACGAQLLLRDLISFPLMRGIGLVTAVALLVENLRTVGDTPLWMRAVLVGSLALLPILGFRFAGRVRAAFGEVRDADMALADEFTNSMSLPLEVQLMGAEPQRAGTFGAAVKRYVRARIRAGLRNEMVSQFEHATPVLLQAGFLIYGVFVALQSKRPGSAGAILAIFYFVPAAVQPLQQMIQFFMGLNSAWPQVESVVNILEAEPEVVDRPGARELPRGKAPLAVKLEGVEFAYAPGGRRVLAALDHEFAPGKATAVVARAGMGKSTILNLVCRTRECDGGAVRVGDVDVRDLTLASLRRTVAKVSQFPLFIADTVRENFKLARADATDAQIEAVCRRTGLWDVLVGAARPGQHPLEYRLPRATSEGLSGGQRRLFAVTRALLLEPAILLLDEPTTGIDAIGRKLLVPLLRDACKGVTVLLVDHDMEFVSSVASTVCVLEDGKFSQVGSPAELAAKPGLFQRLVEASASEKHEAKAEAASLA